MNFCSNCGSDRIEKIIPPDDNRLRLVCQKCSTVHYRNPKIVAGVLPIYGDKVLLCKRAIEPCKGLWNVPSGYLENKESVEAGAAREVWEEALGKVEITGIHAVYSIARISQVYVHFLGNLVEGKFGVGEESLDCRLFSEEEIPWNEMAFTSSTFTLRRYFADRKAGKVRTHLGNYPEEK